MSVVNSTKKKYDDNEQDENEQEIGENGNESSVLETATRRKKQETIVGMSKALNSTYHGTYMFQIAFSSQNEQNSDTVMYLPLVVHERTLFFFLLSLLSSPLLSPLSSSFLSLSSSFLSLSLSSLSFSVFFLALSLSVSV